VRSDRYPTLKLKAGREKSMLRRHPWIFSGAVASLEGSAAPGETVRVVDNRGNFLALGAYSPHSQIRVRVWAWDPETIIDEAFFLARLDRAVGLRQIMLPALKTNSLRLVHAESDGLPGLIVDRYDRGLVVQFLASGPEYWRDTLTGLLRQWSAVDWIYERSDAEVRQLEGLPDRTGSLFGAAPQRLVIEESGLKFWVDLAGGHKTGFYLDQLANRARVRELADGRDVLDCFAYTGGFSVSALQGGARSVLAVEASAEALALGRENVALNELPPESIDWQPGDVFQVLRQLRDQARSFDLIVLDPPKFAPTAAQVQRAARGYKDINLLAFKLLRPGGLLATFSCSGGIDADLFQKIVAGAALDAGVDARIVEHLSQGPDHPVALNFPEGAYLKGLIVAV
jgi:23S rRNA (cytosine1962-C5)-methyltransferase